MIAGATAAGKSTLALRIAAAHNGIVVNADSMQVYSCWRVLTARPSSADEQRVPHALYGHVGGHEHYSVGSWLADFQRVLDSCGQMLPVVVGGTGLYFSALTKGLSPVPAIDPAVRAAGQRLLACGGKGALLDYLQCHDPETLATIDTRNKARLLRAWEVHVGTQTGLRAWQMKSAPPLLPVAETYPLLVWPGGDAVETKIEIRLREMVKAGALDECSAAMADWSPDRPSSKAIGAAEFIAYLQGRTTLSEAVKRASIATRQYAKRQRTWFRSRMTGWHRLADHKDFGPNSAAKRTA